MPSVSRKQQKLMHGIASGSIKGGNGKPTKAVAQKFAAADSARGPKKLPQRASKQPSAAFERKDMAADRKAGIRENTPRDQRIDSRAMGTPNTRAMGAQLPPAAPPKRGNYY